ncbi:hypothetical protein SARC_01228 [Sphaeroforma arctica JP610]|uniref:Uncharacterized protein n=1 Tax=Sphaeroforma arctica JP610 TaxID=667725 RepID=A0A0L0GCL8_9EUKA|nr:hypothetical protein SARC_01228 [Sphaeroforma arctica JP610]KNC86649.1 hypothetical protein SARC_01228 [Sphaeroforma arctica JP610]|eukprot:XP_014160551.1 hypothetical protein SARC_01228 [Sphaeroforma arctica JP610]
MAQDKCETGHKSTKHWTMSKTQNMVTFSVMTYTQRTATAVKTQVSDVRNGN